MLVATYGKQVVRVEDPREDRVDYIHVSAMLPFATARRVAKNSFAVRYGCDPARLRTKVLT